MVLRNQVLGWVCACSNFAFGFGLIIFPSLTHVCLPPIILQPLPPYNGFGSLEDSRQNCVSLRPQPPKKDIIKMLENQHMVLRYTAKLVSDRKRANFSSYRKRQLILAVNYHQVQRQSITPRKKKSFSNLIKIDS